MRILVVEDEPLIAFMNRQILVDAGHEVVGPVASAAEALWLARDNHIDLALLDIDLGRGGNGVDLARCLHQRHGILSIFASGSTTAARCGRDVALGLLSKPYDAGELMLAVTVAGALLTGAQVACTPRGMELF